MRPRPRRGGFLGSADVLEIDGLGARCRIWNDDIAKDLVALLDRCFKEGSDEVGDGNGTLATNGSKPNGSVERDQGDRRVGRVVGFAEVAADRRAVRTRMFATSRSIDGRTG